ncbi:GNAT family N-acetyltransferase [Bacillus sp. TL12]|uniref:GNAT family N-acetyltransferase n=1 Tax=Bacillus sp. TL12 TaxID=2894756 RepID=UPI001F52362F|nr:GNAT family N-acetyltransferase [Bacillus sp. TL12]MCI0765815.1 GNAT family N-acetyltransferase [Bacillus sp. TL12]
MEIYIEKLKEQDAEELFAFECCNRDFFEKMVPSCGDNYYVYETFQPKHDGLLKEQKEGISYFYLIRNMKKSIVGRINLVDIERDRQSGYLGYRVGKDFVGKGIATKAVQLLLNQAAKKQITEIHAKTTNTNVASQIVLGKSGFLRTEIDKTATELNDFIHYVWKHTKML